MVYYEEIRAPVKRRRSKVEYPFERNFPTPRLPGLAGLPPAEGHPAKPQAGAHAARAARDARRQQKADPPGSVPGEG